MPSIELSPERYEQITSILGTNFADTELLNRALRHGSIRNRAETQELRSYERLEFLGDRILGFQIAERLFDKYADWDEGDLTKRLGVLVDNKTLTAAARDLGLDDFVLRDIGRALEDRMLADVVESLIGALYLDGRKRAGEQAGLEQVRSFIDRLAPALEKAAIDITAAHISTRNWIGDLQEWCQKNLKDPGNNQSVHPSYSKAEKSGFDHELQWSVQVDVNGYEAAGGQASTAKAARQQAARTMLLQIQALEK